MKEVRVHILPFHLHLTIENANCSLREQWFSVDRVEGFREKQKEGITKRFMETWGLGISSSYL